MQVHKITWALVKQVLGRVEKGLGLYPRGLIKCQVLITVFEPLGNVSPYWSVSIDHVLLLSYIFNQECQESHLWWHRNYHLKLKNTGVFLLQMSNHRHVLCSLFEISCDLGAAEEARIQKSASRVICSQFREHWDNHNDCTLTIQTFLFLCHNNVGMH